MTEVRARHFLPRHIQSTRSILLSLAMLALLVATAALGDDIYGRIRGTVTDPTGAVVPGATVTATNAATGLTKTATTNSDGSYELPNLPVGIYNLKIEKTGFNAYQAQRIELRLNQIYVANAQLQVGQTSQAVTVEANAAQVDTTSMQLGTVVQSQTIVDMPLNGRNWIQLQQIQPGVVASSDRFGSNYATNGSQTQQNSYLVNGMDTNDLPLNTPLVIPSPDAIGQFNMVTNTINPEYGRNSGAILNAILKNGTNGFHGSLFEFYRDTSLNTKPYFSKKPSVFHQNQFGGEIDGPIWKDHAFFMFSYQGTRARQQQSGGDTQVLTAAERGGNIGAALATSTGVSPFPIAGFPAGTPYATIFPKGQIPTSAFNPISSKLIAQYVPLPNSGTRDYLFNPFTTTKADQFISRVDYNVTHNDTVFGSAIIQSNPTVDTLPFTGASLPGFGETAQRHTKEVVGDWNHTFNSNTLNELRAGSTRFNFVAVKPLQAIDPASLGFKITPQDKADAQIPVIAVSDPTTGGANFTLGFSDNGPQPRIDQTYQVTDNFTKIHGNHTFKAGYEGRRFQVANPFFFLNNGHFDYGANGAFSTGSAVADFLLGIPDDYAQSSGGYISAGAWEHYIYLQDQWKFRPNLTLTYGVGYQIDTPLTDHFNNNRAINCFRPGQQSTVFPTAPAGLVFPGDANCTPSGYHTAWKDFGPRAGFAYSPDMGWLTGGQGNTSIRGGFGIYFNRSEEELTLQNLTAPPFSLTDFGINDDPRGNSPSFAAPYTDVTGTFSIPNKYPFSPPAAGSKVDFTFFEPMQLNTYAPNFGVPYSMNFNLSVQRQMPSQIITTISYVGAQGRRLQGATELNPGINPAGCAANPSCVANRVNQPVLFPKNFRYPGNIFASIGELFTGPTSHYNSLQASLSKQMTHGLSFLLSYTWAHSEDYASSYENSNFVIPYNPVPSYGDSAFDARQRLVFSYSYRIPMPHFIGELGNKILGGWRFEGITSLQSGFPFNLTDSNNRSLTCSTSWTFYGCRGVPNQVAPVKFQNPRSTPGKNLWFNTSAFAKEAFGTFGNVRRNSLHGPGLNNTDIALLKDFHITEREYFEMRLEAFNAFNHTQFKNPNGNVNSGSFGRITSAYDPRLVQLGAKFYF